MVKRRKIRLTKTINRHLLFRDSSHTLPANRLRAYHSPWGRHLLFRSSSHTLLANKFRVYHLPKRRAAVRLALYVILLFGKKIRSFKKSTRAIFHTITHLLIHQNFRKKWAKQLTPVKRSALFTPYKLGRPGRLQPRVLFTNEYGATPQDSILG
jgi:hypothetical protein